MKRLMLTAVVCAATCALADTPYPIDKAKAKANRAAVMAFADKAAWKGAPVAVAAVDPMGGWRYLPDEMPNGGDFTGPMRLMAARGEYENGSVVLFAFKDLADVSIVPTDLAGPGAKIAAAEVDVKVVKTWYQQGTAWYGGFQSDVTRRILTPELMLHDENLVHVDYVRKENYLRCDYGGETAYRWISTTGPDVDHNGCAEPKLSWIRDAEKPVPFALQADCFKQVMFTFHVPAEAKPGLYRADFPILAKGARIASVPVVVRVLAFELPKPMTFRDTNRRFLPSGYVHGLNLVDMPKFAKNLAAHGLDATPGAGQIQTPTRARQAKKAMDENGLDAGVLSCALPGCGVATDYPVKESNKSYRQHLDVKNGVQASMAAIREVFGPDVKAYSYGWDEASPDIVRAERATWQEIHRAGGHTIVSTPYHPYLLFNLDWSNIPRQPRLDSRINAEALHAADPDFVAAWYGDPHSGPENPDYCRRIYGWLTWRNNYDSFCQYILFRDDWTEFFVWKESFLRGLMIAYPAADDVLETLAWEAVREAVDDIRYGTLLKQLAEKARKSADVETVYAGRAASSWIAQVDFERSSLESLRLEMVAKIDDLRNRLEKEGK